MAEAKFVSTGAVTFAALLPEQPDRAVYFGSCEGDPVITKNPLYKPVYADESCEAPFDMVFHGEWAVVTATFNRWNNEVYYRLARRPSMTLLASDGPSPNFDVEVNVGQWSRYEAGALVVNNFQTGFSIPLYIIYPYADGDSQSVQGMVPGYMMPFAFLIGPDDERPGSQPHRLTLSWYCAALTPVAFEYPIPYRLTSGWQGPVTDVYELIQVPARTSPPRTPQEAFPANVLPYPRPTAEFPTPEG